jgi:hypothetical protein
MQQAHRLLQELIYRAVGSSFNILKDRAIQLGWQMDGHTRSLLCLSSSSQTENAGNHLRSHALTRAVPSAQRGLTSVFGMGTGVTLAVYSPANLGVLLDLVSSSVCSDNLNRAVKTHL